MYCYKLYILRQNCNSIVKNSGRDTVNTRIKNKYATPRFRL